MRTILTKIRGAYLNRLNGTALCKTIRKTESKLPAIFVILSPRDFHLAPQFTSGLTQDFRVYLVGNGLSTAMLNWLHARVNGQVIISLTASVFGNAETFLQHAEVIDLIASKFVGDFFICDADCLVTDHTWLRAHSHLKNGAYALGPFGKDTVIPKLRIPDTFLVLLSSEIYRRISGEFSLDASICKSVNSRVQEGLRSRYGQDVAIPEPGKKYVDTLQHFWMASEASGLNFIEIPGAGQKAFHVGGSSYILHNATPDLLHWECWPANTIYFNLRFIECLNDAFVTEIHRHLFDRYGTSKNFLESVPQLRNSWRYQESVRLIDTLFGQVSH